MSGQNFAKSQKSFKMIIFSAFIMYMEAELLDFRTNYRYSHESQYVSLADQKTEKIQVFRNSLMYGAPCLSNGKIQNLSITILHRLRFMQRLIAHLKAVILGFYRILGFIKLATHKKFYSHPQKKNPAGIVNSLRFGPNRIISVKGGYMK